MKKADYLGLAITPGEETLDDPLQAAPSARALAVIVENAELLMHRLAGERYRAAGSS